MSRTSDELRAEAASPAAWRERALELHKDGQQEDCVKVLEESMDAFKEPQRLDDVADSTADRQDTMHMLISAYLMQFLRQAQDSRNVATDDTLRVPLTRASNLLDQVSQSDGDATQSPHTSGMFINRGFHALTQYKLRHASGSSHELTRANMFFTSALKLDCNEPRAILGKAAVFIHWKEWGKALAFLRQILQRRPRKDMMKEIKFSMAVCFCGMERFAQMRSALLGVLELDPDDVETLCALAQLDAFLKSTSDEGAEDSGANLEKAWKLDHGNPVVLLSAAHSAFLVGLEMPSDVKPNGPWDTAGDLLQQVLNGNAPWEAKGDAHYQFGRLKHAQDLFQDAHDEYLKCRQILPEHWACLYGLAQTCLELGLYQEAITALEATRKKYSNVPQVLKLLTFAYLQTQHREAVTTAKVLCAPGVSDDDVEAWSMLAEAHEQRYAAGDEEAIRAANDAYRHVGKLLEAGTGADQASPQMWNNLGTMRGLEGDTEAAANAYARAMTLVEKDKSNKSHEQSDSKDKDLHVTELTVRFNRAWLAESADQPDNLQATSDLLKLREEVSWYADTTLSLGTKWLMIGDFDRAAQTYGQASKQSPVLAALMQAQVYKRQGEFYKALQAARKAVEQASPKQFHYVHVHFGNLYFEFSQEPQFKHNREEFLNRALWHFMEAFKNAKDSHYAAVGIGMVFAQRGRLDFAKRTFQSVLQHKRTGENADDDPSVYINLGHTYAASGGNDSRKAIALYEKARKLRPNNLLIRLYLAQAHFELKEYERCVGILSDALAFWPDDVVLRYHLAICLESWGRGLVSEEKKIDRVVGMNSGKDKVERAVAALSSAASHFGYIKKRWAQMPHDAQKALAKHSLNPSKFMGEIKRAEEHEDYCQNIMERAQEHLQTLNQKREELDMKISQIAAERKMSAEQQHVQQEMEEEAEAEQRHQQEEMALDTMQKVDDITLGRNIGDTNIDKKPAAAGSRARGSREVDLTGGAKVQKAPKAIGDKPLSKKEKKKQKKDKKKDKKKEKKRRKERGGRSSSEEADVDPDVPTHTHSLPSEGVAPTEELPSDQPPARIPTQELPSVEPLLPAEQAKELVSEAEADSEDDEQRDQRKRAKKDKKQNKKEAKKAKKTAKKEKKKRKRSEVDSDDFGELLEPEPADVAGQADTDKRMEAELFGSEEE